MVVWGWRTVSPKCPFYLFPAFSAYCREKEYKESWELTHAPFCCVQRICCFYWENRPIIWSLCFISSFPVTAQPGNYLQWRTLMLRSDKCKRSASPGALGRIIDGSPAFSHNLVTQKCEADLSGIGCRCLAFDGNESLFAAVPLFLATWPHLKDVPFVFNCIYRGHTVQTVLS